jgi:hypothetical protein
VSNLRGALAFRSKRRSSRWGVPRPGGVLRPVRCPRCGRVSFLGEAMSRVPWHLFNDHHRRAHLVVAVLRADQLGGEPNPRAAQIVLARIVKIQKPSSYYATTVVREAGRPQVQLAFEDTRAMPESWPLLWRQNRQTPTQGGQPNGHFSWIARRC